MVLYALRAGVMKKLRSDPIYGFRALSRFEEMAEGLGRVAPAGIGSQVRWSESSVLGRVAKPLLGLVGSKRATSNRLNSGIATRIPTSRFSGAFTSRLLAFQRAL